MTVTGEWPGTMNTVSVDASLADGENTLSVAVEANAVRVFAVWQYDYSLSCDVLFVCATLFRLGQVELWWPAGYGGQKLYNLIATVSNSTMSRRLGFRTSRLQTDSGLAKPGEQSGSGNSSMILLVNGQRILVRGSSLVPLDTFNGRTSAAATRRMLLSTLAGGMNSLRIWGGGTFLPPLFYEMYVRIAAALFHRDTCAMVF